ncbi:hypothetical protein DEO72_LG2g3112 [Vigna unguiculata]|uniref:Uncharacterized protein n=1 Tax=Vigna unguiculata TaxID=3917 RepID=A0A4D6L2N6_VIGUN|nr:hypothetical protein DEO72_LG2g3112 [Vigna unguiculata]
MSRRSFTTTIPCPAPYTHLEVYKRQHICHLLPNLSATPDKARARNHCYGSYTGTPGGFPNYEHKSYWPKTTKPVNYLLKRALYLNPSVLATTSTLTPVTLANPSSTQGFLVFIRHPELNSRDAIPSSTRGMLRA